MKHAPEAFTGDPHLGKEFERLVKRFGIKTIVETGTYHGHTAKAFAKMAPAVYTIEANPAFYEISKKNLRGCRNVKLLFGNSPEVLREILPKAKRPILFFLDAHWERDWPLLDELQAIADNGCQDSVIVVHDCYVPGKDFGYDQYTPSNNLILYYWKGGLNKISELVISKPIFKRQRLDYEYMRGKLRAINPKHKHYFNKKAAGTRRGVIFVHP